MDSSSTSCLASTNNKFCLELFKTIFPAGSQKNVFISPISIAAAVAMAQLGAKAETANGIERALCLKPDEGNKIHEQFQTYLSSLKTDDDDNFSLSIANRIYVQQSFKVLEEFKRSTSKYYLAEPKSADFASAAEAECSKINAWVSEQTENKIKDLIPRGGLDVLTRMVIVNAIYFKGNWNVKFSNKETKAKSFKISPGQTKSVPTMKSDKKYSTGRSADLNCRVIELPYIEEDLSMVIILPDEDFGLQTLTKSLDHEKLQQLLGSLEKTKQAVSLTVPKFEVTSSHSLKESLSALGMSDAFNMDKADFSGITGTNDLYIADAIHKAYIKVDEEGTEAAAATAMKMGVKCRRITPPSFHVDHPFLYLIKDNRANGLVLFIGSVVDPSLK